jgi:hypothetical protein
MTAGQPPTSDGERAITVPHELIDRVFDQKTLCSVKHTILTCILLRSVRLYARPTRRRAIVVRLVFAGVVLSHRHWPLVVIDLLQHIPR